MKAALFYLILLCQVPCALGQGRKVHLPHKQFNDSLNFWYQWARKSEKEVGLEPIATSPHDFHFRLSGTGGEIIDVWQQDSVWQGYFTKWVRDANKFKNSDRGYDFIETPYYKNYILSSMQAAEAGQLLRTSSILSLPSDEHIPGWTQGLDGYEVVIQCSTRNNYCLKTYWTPNLHFELAEARLLQQFTARLNGLINAELVRKAFEVDIPFPCYTTDNAMETCRIVTTTKYQQYEREFAKKKRQARRNKVQQ